MKINIIILAVASCFCTVAFSQNSLQNYIELAEQNSPLLQKQENNKRIIDLDLKQFNAIYKAPNINLNSNAIFLPIISKDGNTNKLEWVSSGSSEYLGYDLGATNGGQFQAIISINQPLFTHKYIAAQQNKTDILQERNLSLTELTKAELKQVVTHQYILCVQSQKQKENIRNTIQVLEEQIQQMKALVNAGIYKLIDLKLLEIELENDQIEEERLNGSYLDNFNSLKLLCGINDSTLVRLDEVNLVLNSPTQTSSLFASQFKFDSLTLIVEQKIFNLKYLPQVGVFGDAGLNATYQPALNRLGFSVGVFLKWNLFDGHQRKTNDEKTIIQLSNIETDRKYFENQNDIRKKNILSQITNLDKQLRLIDKQLSEYNNLLELYKIEINQGLISVLELKTLIREISMKQQIKTNTLMAKEILINSYNYWNL
ncbi:TolC family protein [Tenuifilum thalassicum]|uniref:TolC family protein n=1 Tax=Tenuifilum thalassicum TaxID=2590900 RepID=A0A7D3Y5K2_9BACT|nr:TolC family protein [Tenuifilum thalassicum]QKG80689.1 TolC family protein [Tenuifilum thalassicum]